MDAHTFPLASRSEVVTRECCQEAQLFTNFAKAVESGSSSELSDYHAQISLNTQAVLDAILASAETNGKDVVEVVAP